MSRNNRISAVILAAGFSSRMGELKALLDIGGKKAITHLIDETIKAGIEDIIVVLGYKSEEIAAEIIDTGVNIVVNENFINGMYSSVQKGVKSISPASEGFMIMPVDIPLIKAHTIKEISEFFIDNNYHIICPFFNNFIGHPPVLSKECISTILNSAPAGGLHEIINSPEWSSCKFHALDQGILYEMDTKEQYRKLLEYHSKSYIPNESECMEIIKRCGVPDNIVIHMKAVADTALKIGRAITEAGWDLDLNMLYAAALLHDIKRQEANHPLKAKEFLSELGYEKLGDIVWEHMDLSATTLEMDGLNEKEVLYLSDKLVQEHKLVGLGERFEKVLNNYKMAEEKIKTRYEHAISMAENVELLTGKTLEEIILSEEKQNCG